MRWANEIQQKNILFGIFTGLFPILFPVIADVIQMIKGKPWSLFLAFSACMKKIESIVNKMLAFDPALLIENESELERLKTRIETLRDEMKRINPD